MGGGGGVCVCEWGVGEGGCSFQCYTFRSTFYCGRLCKLITAIVYGGQFLVGVILHQIPAHNNNMCCAKPLTPALVVAPCQVWQSQAAPQYRLQLKYLLEPVLLKTSSYSVLVNKQRYNKWESSMKNFSLLLWPRFLCYMYIFLRPLFSDPESFHDVFQHHQRWQTILPKSSQLQNHMSKQVK